jgi:acetolactate synthase-1/2/3 large subunit
MPRVADFVARTLKAYDTEYFFFVTGGDQALWIALEDAGIRMVACRSEKGAAYMADGYARVSGKPGFVYGQYGPGVSNVAAGLADPYWSMSPVISLTTSMRTTSRDRYDYQELDQLPLHAPLTRWNRAVGRPDRAPEMVRAAIRAATGSPPGPAHLEIPADMLRAEIDGVRVYREPAFGQVPSLRTAPPPEAAARLADALLQAERPVLIAGNGVLLSQAWDEVEALAEALSLPVATSMGGKGAIREDHDLAVGVIGRYSRKSANDLVRRADLALVVGCRLGGMATDSYTVPDPRAHILHVDVDTQVLGATYREEVSVQADAKLALASVLEEVRRRDAVRDERTPWARHVAETTQAWRNEALRACERPAGQPIHPGWVMDRLRSALAPTDILVADTGYMGAWTGALFPVTAPGRHYIRAAGSLGWALPASLGAALAAPGRRVVCVTGDGGVGYHVAELETAARYGITVLIVVLNNRSLAFEYHDQKYLFERVLPAVNDFTDVDYGRVAADFGGRGQRVGEAAELDEAIRGGLAGEGPALLDVLVDKEVHAPVTVFEHVLQRAV